MMNETSETIARVLRRWWVVVLVTALIVSLAAWQVRSAPEQYRASMVLIVAPVQGLEQAESLQVADMLRNQVTIGTYADVLESPMVVAEAMNRTGLPFAARSDYSVQVVTEPDSNVVRIQAEGPNRATTALLLTSMHAAGDEILAGIFPLFTLTSLSGETIAAESVKTSYTTILPISLVVGVGVGVFAALWTDVVLMARAASGSLYGAVNGRTSRAASSMSGDVSKQHMEQT